MSRSTQFLPRLGVVALAALAAGQAAAETSPFIFRVSEQLTYDSNIFRTQDNEKRDLYSTTALTAAIDQPYGRQRYLASATVNGQVFKNQDQLNNVGYELQAGMDWEAASRLSGDLRVMSTRSLVSYANYNQGQTDREKVMQTTNTANFRARYGLAAPFAVEGTLAYRSIGMSGEQLDNQEVRNGTAGAAVIYQPSDLLSLGLGVRYSDGKYPYYTADRAPDPYTRTDIDLTVRWKLSGLSTLDGRFTSSNEKHSDLPLRDFNGFTSQVSWLYQVTGKTQLGLTYRRDTGNNTDFVDNASSGTTIYGSPSRLTDTVGLNARWDATAKIRVTADASFGHDSYSFSDGQDAGSGNTRGFRLAANYQASRALLFSCGAGYAKRTGPGINTLPGSYTANTVDCLARLTLQ